MSQANKQAISYFIADLHLSEQRSDISHCFIQFLAEQAIHAEALFILGDLFEYWLGDDDDNPWVNQIATAIRQLSDSGTRVFFICGNRDFLLGEKFCKKAGMALLDDVTRLRIYQQDLVIMHGDTLCTRDIAYQAFRRKSRSWWWQAMVKALPLFVRKRMAERYRQQSAAATQQKPADIMDVTPEEVVKCLAHYHCQLLIHGHTHRPAIHQLTVNNQPATRIVLGDWYQQGSWLKFSADGYELINQPFTS